MPRPETIAIAAGSGPSRVLVNAPLGNLPLYLPPAKTVILTDARVRRLYGKSFPDAAAVLLAGTGERQKSLRRVEALYRRLLELGVDRSSFILAIGGGLVCDIAGFTASTFLRGIPFAFVPTTLLAQVDAAIGGKNGVNFLGFKNMIGLVRQPRFVLCDLEVLRTLPARQRAGGFAEVIKAAAIADLSLFKYLEQYRAELRRLDMAPLTRAIASTVRVKAGIVARDELESGERKKLNFGHTLGHALELTHKLPHGRAVSIGMALAADISVRRKRLAASDALRLKNLLEGYGLPTRCPFNRAAILSSLRRDKKKNENRLNLVLLRSLGQACLETVDFQELEEYVHDLC
ncbi:MAG: 3-dehydroquinate synthase [Candidatus Aminicenantales bacterium]